MSTGLDKFNSNIVKSKSERGWLLIRILIALVLLVAAGAKFLQLITVPSLGIGLLHARWFNIIIVEFELFFGIWLIFGLLPRLTQLVSIGLFSMFSVVSFYKAAILLETSCGCFGAVSISPWISMTLDLMITGLLLIFLPKNFFCPKILCGELTELRHKSKIITVIVIWLVITVPIMFAMLSVSFVTLTEKSHLSENEKSITLEPNNWFGKRFPLLAYIEFDDNDFKQEDLKTGEWTILLYHNDCLKCQEILAKLENRHNNENLEKLVVLEVSRKEVHQKYINTEQIHVKKGSLQRDREWFVQTPVWIVLKNELVVGVHANEKFRP
ncbi:MAG: DoxX family protein [Bacteroidales bacterium]|jgi:uncharacterized membrane protein YphA (DoxX/SURF4 family)|nr:DoxX family protein [Bacteroidales bacterium]